jgi:hypothetical protein
LAISVNQHSNKSQELIDIRNFIDLEEERVIDSDAEITERIILHYSNKEDEECDIEEEVIKKVSVFDAIIALNTLKSFEEQRDQLADQGLMRYLRKELCRLESERLST